MVKLVLGLVIGVAAVDDRWSSWKKTFGIEISGDEEELRSNIFKSNAAFVDEQNAKNNSFTLALNKFAHLSNEEFRQLYMSSPQPSDDERVSVGEMPSIGASPVAVDWRNQSGVLQPVKDQGKCGSCWAFAAIASVESGFAISTGASISLSEQQLIDCDADCRNCTANPSNPEHRNGGCAGGFARWAFNYMENVSLCTEASYTYSGTDPQTNLNNCSAATCAIGVPVGVIQGYMSVNTTYTHLNQAVAQQPVAVSVDADVWWQFYSGGVLDGSGGCSGTTNHAVTVVGYAPSTDSRYDFEYIIRNSWGASWGEAGYVRIPSLYHVSPQDESKWSPCCMLLNPPTFPVLQSEITI